MPLVGFAAGGNIAHQLAASGPADGSMILLESVGPLTIALHLIGKLDFASTAQPHIASGKLIPLASPRVAAAILDRWNLELVKALKSPGVVEALNRRDLTPIPTSRDALARYEAQETATWGKAIRERRIGGE